jgi:RNA polymerase sigma factor (sigma-70 family)
MTATDSSTEDQDLVRTYLGQIGTIQLLTAAQEVELARRIEVGVYASALLDAVVSGPPVPGRSRADLETLAADGRRARAAMIKANLRLVVAAARQLNRGKLSLLDAIQEGNLGLIHAVEKFDHTKGYKFSTYATWWIRQAIGRGAATNRSIRLPMHVEDELNRVLAARRALTADLGREPTDDDISVATGLTTDRVGDLLRFARTTVSLDVPTGDDGDSVPLGELIEDVELPTAHDIVEHDALVADVRAAVADLPYRERRAVRMRFGLGTGQPSTLREIGDELGVSRERARQVVHNGLRLLGGPQRRHPLVQWRSGEVAEGAA